MPTFPPIIDELLISICKLVLFIDIPYNHSTGGINMRQKKYRIAISGEEYSLIIRGLVHFRNKLISEGRYTDAVDELILKITK